MKKFALPVAFSLILSMGLMSFVLAAPVAVHNGDDDAFTCGSSTGPKVTASSTYPHDLIVPQGAQCNLVATTIVGRDVIVEEGANLHDVAAHIGHDIDAYQPQFIGIGGSKGNPGYVGHDVRIDGATGTVGPNPFNFVCNTNIGRDLTIENSPSRPAVWYVGDDPRCDGGNQVGHNLIVRNNQMHVDVSENGTNNGGGLRGGIGNNLNVIDNTSVVVEGNVVGHDAKCEPAPGPSDGDFVANSVRDKNEGCP